MNCPNLDLVLPPKSIERMQWKFVNNVNVNLCRKAEGTLCLWTHMEVGFLYLHHTQLAERKNIK